MTAVLDVMVGLVAVMWLLPLVGVAVGLVFVPQRPQVARWVMVVTCAVAAVLAVGLTAVAFGYLLAQVVN
ncbi:MAG: hypothetical protein ACK53T_00125 [Planctomycetota bacterium]